MLYESEIAKTLSTYSGTLNKLRINRHTPCEPEANGFVLDANDEWFLLWQFHDFFPDGFALLRVDGVSSIRFGEHEQFWTKMLDREGLTAVLPDPQLTLDSLQNMLGQLQSKQDNFVVQCEDSKENVADFYIGRLIELQDDTCSFANFDALGRWDTALSTINLCEITRIEWQTPYCVTFSRHLEGECPHLS